jgi:hypothetical protein
MHANVPAVLGVTNALHQASGLQPVHKARHRRGSHLLDLCQSPYAKRNRKHNDGESGGTCRPQAQGHILMPQGTKQAQGRAVYRRRNGMPVRFGRVSRSTASLI